MSFSSEVKEELALLTPPARHCRIALIAALFHMCPALTKDSAGIRTENAFAAKAYEHALRRTFTADVERSESGREITVQVSGKEQVRTFLETIKLDPVMPTPEEGAKKTPRRGEMAMVSKVLLQKTCCRKAFLRGLFLAAGSVSDPSRSYHLEIAPLSEEESEEVKGLLALVGFQARCTRRKGRSVVYMKDGEQISDFLGAIGATKSLMKLENARILRDIAGNINRQVNFEAANLKKTGIAAMRQLEDIQLIERTIGISSLSPALAQAARLRAENPDGSLLELAQASNPPVGKSGINHRLQRLGEIAERLREKEEGGAAWQ